MYTLSRSTLQVYHSRADQAILRGPRIPSEAADYPFAGHNAPIGATAAHSSPAGNVMRQARDIDSAHSRHGPMPLPRHPAVRPN